MLKYHVDISKPGLKFNPQLYASKIGQGTSPIKAPVLPPVIAEKQSPTVDSVADLSFPQAPIKQDDLATNASTAGASSLPVVRFKEADRPKPGFNNGPLLMETMGEPVYMDEIRCLDQRYPGVSDKLKNMEIEAAAKGYCPLASKELEASVLESPPWPTTTFGNPRENITAKAKELQASHPELNTNMASTYDFKAAATASDKLLATLDGLFPADELPGLAMSTRAKAPGSLSNKMDKMVGLDPNFTMAHLTDSVGARVDAPDLKSMGEVAKRLEKLYDGKIIAKSDYVTQPGDNGYRAIHYIIDIGGRMAEIQTSTSSLRTADLATHDTVYKAEFPVSAETSKELATAADRIMFLECRKAKGMD